MAVKAKAKAAAPAVGPDVSPGVATFMRLLADPTRRRIFVRLMAGEVCNCDMVCELDLPQSLISHHLRQLHDGGLVTARRDEKDHRWIYYAVNTETLGAVHEELARTFDPATIGPTHPCATGGFGAADCESC
jgi:DNA-binding transcriptional ArsR family regulator